MKKKSQFTLWILGIFSLFPVLIISIFFLIPKEKIENELRNLLQKKIGLNLNFESTRFSLSGVGMIHPELKTESGKPFLKATEIWLKPNWLKLITGTISFESLKIKSPRLTLAKEKNKWNYNLLLKNKKNRNNLKKTFKEKSKKKSLISVNLDKIQVADLRWNWSPAPQKFFSSGIANIELLQDKMMKLKFDWLPKLSSENKIFNSPLFFSVKFRGTLLEWIKILQTKNFPKVLETINQKGIIGSIKLKSFPTRPFLNSPIKSISGKLNFSSLFLEKRKFPLNLLPIQNWENLFKKISWKANLSEATITSAYGKLRAKGNFNVIYKKNWFINVKKMIVHKNQNQLFYSGSLNPTPNGTLKLQWDMGDIQKRLKLSGKPWSGRLNLETTIKSSIPQQGIITIRDLSVEGFSAPKLTLKLNYPTFKLSDSIISWKQFKWNATAIGDWNSKTVLLNLNIDRLRLELLLKEFKKELGQNKSKEKNKTSNIEPFSKSSISFKNKMFQLRDWKIKVKLDAEMVEYAGYQAKKLNLGLSTSSNKIILEPISAQIYGGKFSGSIVQTSQKTSLTAKLYGLNGKKMYKALVGLKDPGYLITNIDGNFSATQKNGIWDGKFQLHSGDGKLYHSFLQRGVLNGILEPIESSLIDVDFSKFILEGNFSNKKIYLEELIFDSNEWKIMVTGESDLKFLGQAQVQLSLSKDFVHRLASPIQLGIINLLRNNRYFLIFQCAGKLNRSECWQPAF